MSRKITISFITLILLLSLMITGCGMSINSSNDSQASSSNANNNAASATAKSDSSGAGSVTVAVNENEGSFDAEDIANNISVTGYTYSSSYYNYVVLVLKNNSGSDCKLEVSVNMLDSDDKIVGTETNYVYAFSDNTEVALGFSCEDSFSKYEYKLKASEIEYYVAVNQDLTCDVNIATNKAVISATNNGSIAAEFVEYYALFFKGDKLVYTNWGYIDDSDSEIKPGDTVSEEASCYEDFDSVKVYLDGRGSKD